MLMTPAGRPTSSHSREIQHGKRRLLRGLDHHRAAGGEGGGHLPRRHVERPVPGHDRCNDADGLPHGPGKMLTGNRYLARCAVELGCESGHVAQQIRRAQDVHLDAGADRFAVVDGLDLAESLRMRLDGLCEPEQQSLAFRRFHRGPRSAIERVACRADRTVHIGIRRRWHRCQVTRRGRLGDVDGLVNADELAVDVHALCVAQERCGLGRNAIGLQHAFDRRNHRPLPRVDGAPIVLPAPCANNGFLGQF